MEARFLVISFSWNKWTSSLRCFYWASFHWRHNTKVINDEKKCTHPFVTLRKHFSSGRFPMTERYNFCSCSLSVQMNYYYVFVLLSSRPSRSIVIGDVSEANGPGYSKEYFSPQACLISPGRKTSGPFVWDTSPRSIDREGLEESRTWQASNHITWERPSMSKCFP